MKIVFDNNDLDIDMLDSAIQSQRDQVVRYLLTRFPLTLDILDEISNRPTLLAKMMTNPEFIRESLQFALKSPGVQFMSRLLAKREEVHDNIGVSAEKFLTEKTSPNKPHSLKYKAVMKVFSRP